VQLTGIGTAVSLSATSLMFPLQNVGSTSAGQIVKLTNHGSMPISITSVATAGDFRGTRLCPQTIRPQGWCVMSVRFNPTETGVLTGTLTITDSDPGSPHMVALTGTGTAPEVEWGPSSLSFAGRLVGTSSTPQSVTLVNVGYGPLTIRSITASGDFTSTPGQCAGTVAPGASCEIAVVFKPQAGGSRTGSLSIVDDAANSPQSVGLSGTGQDFGVSASATSASVMAGQTASYTLSLAAEGGFPGAVSLTCTGAPATATCLLTPSSVTLAGSGATPVTVRVTTTTRSMAPPAGRRLSPGSVSPAVLLLFTLLIVLAMVAQTRPDSPPQRQLLWAPLGAVLLFITLWTGCGGGGITFRPPPVTGTPAGTYTLTVAASGSGLTKNVSLALVVN
jgi:Abnormal spindle-like microcephaly-assoc'd, ASPM-SPD-2-Hydin